jgi:hypothetical protein
MVVTVRRRLAGVIVLLVGAAACGHSSRIGTRADVSETLVANIVQDSFVHTPPEFAARSDVIRLAFRPTCSASNCQGSTAVLHVSGLDLIPLKIDPNQGFVADITVGETLEYWAELKVDGTLIRSPRSGSHKVPVVTTGPTVVDVGTLLEQGRDITLPTAEAVLEVGSGEGQIGIVVGNQGAGTSPSRISVSPLGGVVVPDPVNKRLMLFDQDGKGGLTHVRLDHGASMVAQAADGTFVTQTASKVRHVAAGGTTISEADVPGLICCTQLLSDQTGVWIRGPGNEYLVLDPRSSKLSDGTITRALSVQGRYVTSKSTEFRSSTDKRAVAVRLDGNFKVARVLGWTDEGSAIAIAQGEDPNPVPAPATVTIIAITTSQVVTSIRVPAESGRLTEAPPIVSAGPLVYVLDHRSDGQIHIARYDPRSAA